MGIGRVKTDLITDSAITEAKLGVGTGSGTAITQWHVDNLTMNSNQLSTQNSSDLILFPDTQQVGINTSSPGATLDVNGTLQAGSLKMDNTTLSTVGTNENLVIDPNGSGKIEITQDILPDTNATVNLGSDALRFANVYTSDLHLRNEQGNWTIQEGSDNLYIINNKNGKKYKFNLTEV
jgi:hypothetical protein